MSQVLKIVKRFEMTNLMEEKSRWLATPSKYARLGTAIAAKLIIGIWFGIGVILPIRVMDSLNHSDGVLTSGEAATKMEAPGAVSEATITKMEEPVSEAATTEIKGPDQVMTVDPKKCNQSLRLALWNRMKKEELKKLRRVNLS